MNQFNDTDVLKKRNLFSAEFWKCKGYLFFCALIPAILSLLMYISRGLYPIENGSVLVLDLNGQYVWFFEALRNFVKGDASLLYSFSRALGGEFLGIYAYYLASPLSYLLCLFPQKRMLEGLLVLFLIKTALCGLSFGIYMDKTSKEPKKLPIIIFSIFYALTAYGIIQQHNTMWIDAMMWLPLITLGMESLIKEGKWKLYTFFLAVTLFSNFYIGYMVCIYCVFYFILYYIAHAPKKESNPLGETAHFPKTIGRVIFFSLLAVGMAFVILISAYYSLSFGKSTFSNTKWVWRTNFDILDLFYKLIPGGYDTVRPDGYPFVYSGMLTLLLLPSYFLCKMISMREKICAGVFVLFFVVCFSLSVTDLIWHGFQQPNWLNYRYSFMLCFVLCCMSCRALSDFENLSLKTVMTTGLVIAGLLVMLQKYTDDKFVKPNDLTCIWFSLILVFIYLSALGVMRSGKSLQAATVGLATVVCLECFLNGLICMEALNQDVVYSSYSSYNDYLNKTRPITEAVQDQDDSFYRMEKTFNRKLNDNMAVNVRGLSGSTSTLNQETIRFLDKMGYASSSHWSKYAGGNPVNDSLLGIKYILTDLSENMDHYQEVAKDDANGYKAYKNPYALSLAFGVDSSLLDFPLGYVQVQPEEKDEDDKKEEKKQDTKKKTDDASYVGDAVSDIKSFINSKLGIDETERYAEYVDAYNSPMARLNAMLTSMLGSTETVEVFVPITSKNVNTTGLKMPWYAENHACYDKEGTDASYEFTVTVPQDGELYFYLPSKYQREVKVSVFNETAGGKRSQKGNFGSGEFLRILSLGNYSAGDELTIRLELNNDALYVLNNQPCCYVLDWETFEKTFAELAKDQYQITQYTEDSFTGTFTPSRDNETVLTSLAYDSGWQITVNGQKVKTEKALGALVSFTIPGDAGKTYEVKMNYRPKTLEIGSLISLGSVGIFLLLICMEPVLKKIPLLRSTVGAVPGKKKAKTHHRRKQSNENRLDHSSRPKYGNPNPTVIKSFTPVSAKTVEKAAEQKITVNSDESGRKSREEAWIRENVIPFVPPTKHFTPKETKPTDNDCKH